MSTISSYLVSEKYCLSVNIDDEIIYSDYDGTNVYSVDSIAAANDHLLIDLSRQDKSSLSNEKINKTITTRRTETVLVLPEQRQAILNKLEELTNG